MSKCETCVHKRVCWARWLFGDVLGAECKQCQPLPDGTKCGEWIAEEVLEEYTCSVCEGMVSGDFGDYKPFAFCPHCGTRMEEENNG